ncbi:hypothetical protein BLFGPEAP_01739 [Candidatus Methanoperedenaceae archaeon GB50]|nr:hypothetical protein BLFGPEAP_01739 [Candidatus Methanoperedenaceae archaeon GB50]
MLFFRLWTMPVTEVGRGEIFGYIEFGDTKTLTRQIKVWGDPWIKEWRVERTYVIER